LLYLRTKSFECAQRQWVGFWGGPLALPKPLPLPQIVVTLKSFECARHWWK